MKRSEINRLQREAIAFCREHNFNLPSWALWRPADYQRAGEAAAEIKKRRLGWDVTDYGRGDFKNAGMVLFTIRNGPRDLGGQPYCEKIIIMRQGQSLPIHFHYSKIEDIINRSGGRLLIKVWNKDKAEKLSKEPVQVLIDGGVLKEYPAGSSVELQPGGSITLTPGMYHSFEAADDVLIGEVSSVNDDTRDNHFMEPTVRFSAIEEDEEILHYLCNEYP